MTSTYLVHTEFEAVLCDSLTGVTVRPGDLVTLVRHHAPEKSNRYFVPGIGLVYVYPNLLEACTHSL